jgi:hypothetical protein
MSARRAACLTFLLILLGHLRVANVALGDELGTADLIELPRRVLGRSVHSATKVLGAPTEVTTQQLDNRHAAGLRDQIVTLTYPWGSVSIYRAMVGSPHELELPFGVTVHSPVPQLAGLPTLGSTRAAVRARLGSPEAETPDSLKYQGSWDGESQPDYLTLRFEDNSLSELSWAYGVD